ncbi:hypothetical protein CLV63_11933 [Murinocardiopsis flavida]|uniref:DNA-directed RNA polymerase specialized sigma24 family protein n=1 Tax=Murinocardiopsis flavida TaxID=645275 RepID=A0A2P8D3F8_9ACTN|nr:sigma-70 family RNA polymerase sigma factor [Murinocardiopsis flavida]PSK91752.1 hypothetical protein CLV63_11933 [Murinocardiopsis flavida]
MAPDTEPAPIADPYACAEDEPLRPGWTARAIVRLANYAATHYRYATPLPWGERRDIAWSAIAEHLYAAAEPPDIWDLIRAGWNAITAHTRKHRAFHGQTEHGAAPQFHRYWMLASSPTGSPEERVVERLALDQIWAALSPRQQELISALYYHEDYTRAAASLGLPVSSFYSMISRARRAFTALWHEHETPTRAWGNDVRSGRPRHKHVTTTAIRQRTRSRAQRPDPGPGYRARRDIGITDTRLRARYDNGATITELAREYGMGWASIQNRITNPKS